METRQKHRRDKKGANDTQTYQEDSHGYFEPVPTPPIARRSNDDDYMNLQQPGEENAKRYLELIPTSSRDSDAYDYIDPPQPLKSRRKQAALPIVHKSSENTTSRDTSLKNHKSRKHRSLAATTPTNDPSTPPSRPNVPQAAESHTYESIDVQEPAQTDAKSKRGNKFRYFLAVIGLILGLGVLGTIVAVVFMFRGSDNPGVTTTPSDTSFPMMSGSISLTTTKPTTKMTTTLSAPMNPKKTLTTGTFIMECDAQTWVNGSSLIADICWSDDSTLIVGQDYGKQLIKVTVDIQARQCVSEQVIGSGHSWVSQVSCDNRNNKVYVAYTSGSIIRIYDTETGDLVDTWILQEIFDPRTITSNENYIFVGHYLRSRVYLYKRETREFVRYVSIDEHPDGLAYPYIGNDNILLFATGGLGHKLVIYNMTTGTTLVRGGPGCCDGDGELNVPYGLTQTSDGTILVGDSFNDRVSMWSVQGEYLGVLKLVGGGVIRPFSLSAISVRSTTYLAVKSGANLGKSNQFLSQHKVRIYRLS